MRANDLLLRASHFFTAYLRACTPHTDSWPHLLQGRTLVFRAPSQGGCDEWAANLQAKIFELRSTDFASSIGDEDTRFWAETVKVPCICPFSYHWFILIYYSPNLDAWAQET